MDVLTWIGILATAWILAVQEAPDDRLYGRVVTVGGEVYQGYIRWDRNEGSWVDLLDGDKEMPRQNLEDAERLDDDRANDRSRHNSISILGLRISWDDDGDGYTSSMSSGIRFGHLRRIRVVGDDRAVLELKSGAEVEMEGGSTDLGDELRELVVQDPERGEVTLRWRDLEEVEFRAAPSGDPGIDRRLHGTLTTRRGEEYTGYIAWDVDEIFESDILDGEERGRKREIPFDRIAAIERAGSSGARVVLRNGEELMLRGTNDVNDDNRGISVSDPGLGQVTVEWDEFDELRFHPAQGTQGRYDAFDGGHALFGTVRTDGGETHTGWIRWDNDEAWSWEILDGVRDDVDFDVEFGRIERIVRQGSRGSLVYLLDGRSVALEDSNDVDDGNKGIYLTPEGGETMLIPWWDFTEVTFRQP